MDVIGSGHYVPRNEQDRLDFIRKLKQNFAQTLRDYALYASLYPYTMKQLSKMTREQLYRAIALSPPNETMDGEDYVSTRVEDVLTSHDRRKTDGYRYPTNVPDRLLEIIDEYTNIRNDALQRGEAMMPPRPDAEDDADADRRDRRDHLFAELLANANARAGKKQGAIQIIDDMLKQKIGVTGDRELLNNLAKMRSRLKNVEELRKKNPRRTEGQINRLGIRQIHQILEEYRDAEKGRYMRPIASPNSPAAASPQHLSAAASPDSPGIIGRLLYAAEPERSPRMYNEIDDVMRGRM